MKPHTVKPKGKKAESSRHFNIEKVNIKGFGAFCGNNTPLIITVSIMLFFTYGIKLFWYSIGIDTELFMADTSGSLKWSLQIGRFGYVLLSKLLYTKGFNPFTAVFVTFCFIWFFTISWCYIIAVFSGDTGRNNRLIPFALVLMTAPVWAEQFYFLHQAVENAFIISLCPYVIYLLYRGFLNSEKGKIVSAFILLVFMVSVYQAIVPMFCCGIFICFLLLQEYSDYKGHSYRNLCLKLFILLVGSLALYFIIARIIIPGFFHIEKADYLDNMNKWGKLSIKENIGKILLFGYTITIGHIPQVQSIANPIIARYAPRGMQSAEDAAGLSKITGNILLLPAALFFLIGIISFVRRKLPPGRRLLYALAGVGIPFCIIFLAVIGGSRPPIRSLYSLPLAFAFMLFFLTKTYKRKAAVFVVCLSLLMAAYQAVITAQLFYSDQVRYNEDVRFANELDKLIIQTQPNGENLPVALIGKYEAAPRFHANFLQGQVIGHSFFEWDNTPASTTCRGLAFMKSLGMYFDTANGNQLEQALKEAALMPAYPDPGCVKRMRGFIIVRISETLYDKAF